MKDNSFYTTKSISNEKINLLNEVFNNILNKKESLLKEIDNLENDVVVKKYFKLKEELKEISSKEIEIYKKIKMLEYESCNHLFVYSRVDYDYYDGRYYKSCGCVKCGIRSDVLDKNKEGLTIDEEVMLKYINNKSLEGIRADIICDLDLAHAIYSKLKSLYPTISDEDMISYISFSLKGIRLNPVNEDRKQSRIKRLLLKPNFNKWNEHDVYNK